jgi:hypothetical protein
VPSMQARATNSSASCPARGGSATRLHSAAAHTPRPARSVHLRPLVSIKEAAASRPGASATVVTRMACGGRGSRHAPSHRQGWGCPALPHSASAGAAKLSHLLMHMQLTHRAATTLPTSARPPTR